MLFQLDCDSVRWMVGGILLRVCRGTGYADIVGLSASLVVKVDDHPVQDVLVPLALLMRVVVDAEDADMFILELDLVVLAVHRRRIERGHRCGTRGRAFQVDLENSNRVITGVLGNVGSARRAPANIASAKFNCGRSLAFLAGHHAVVEVNQHTVRGMSVLRDRRHPRLERRHNNARLRGVESRHDRNGRGGALSLQTGYTHQDEQCVEASDSHEPVPPTLLMWSPDFVTSYTRARQSDENS